MINFDQIRQVDPAPFMVTWDVGRRCNYDCSYCPAHRHDNFSSHASLQDLTSTTDFVFEYIDIIAEHRIHKEFNISFTGGEPTVNPNFIPFARYLKQKKGDRNVFLDLTSNGAMSKPIADAVIENFDYITISYHAEADKKLKDQVKQRIMQFHNSNITLKINVMMHAEYFNDCVDFCNWLDRQGVKYIPRTIDRENLDTHAHEYTQEQKDWYAKYWQKDSIDQGRPCCGGRTMGLCSATRFVESKYVDFREFKGWHCSVNWYFLHIEQQTKQVYHHQTCQARLDGTRGPIGSLDAAKDLISSLRARLNSKSMPVIVCPNKTCGCGLCTPKSKNRDTLLQSLSDVIIDTKIIS